jgi:hypothetical protein
MISDDKNGRKPLDLASIRARLASDAGNKMWRSLDEVAETE